MGRCQCDRISLLPEHILIIILSRVPIKEAARTSVLSKQWKDIWLSLPVISLDSSLGFDSGTEAAASSASSLQKLTSRSPAFRYARWEAAVTNILLTRFLLHDDDPNHADKIRYCKIIFPANANDGGRIFLDGILRYLGLVGGVKCLKLTDENEAGSYEVPIDIFFNPSLEVLIIDNCFVSFRPPPRYAGCTIALRQLHLYLGHVDQSEFDLLMSVCAFLQSLTLFGVHGIDTSAVRASTRLSTLYPYGSWDALTLSTREATASLATLTLYIEPDPQGRTRTKLIEISDSEGRTRTKLIQILNDISRLKNLTLRYEKHCYQDEVEMDPDMFRLPPLLPPNNFLLNLKNLELLTSLADPTLLQIFCCLLQSAPNLRLLTIEDNKYGLGISGTKYWHKQPVAECMKGSLQSVQLKNVSLFCMSVVGFLMFILENTSSIKNMTAFYRGSQLQTKIVDHYLRTLEWASGHVALHLTPFVAST